MFLNLVLPWNLYALIPFSKNALPSPPTLPSRPSQMVPPLYGACVPPADGNEPHSHCMTGEFPPSLHLNYRQSPPTEMYTPEQKLRPCPCLEYYTQ